jgi:hypothetical protein
VSCVGSKQLCILLDFFVGAAVYDENQYGAHLAGVAVRTCVLRDLDRRSLHVCVSDAWRKSGTREGPTGRILRLRVAVSARSFA